MQPCSWNISIKSWISNILTPFLRLMKIYHKIQNTFFQNFDFSHIKENRKNGCDIIHGYFLVTSSMIKPLIWFSSSWNDLVLLLHVFETPWMQWCIVNYERQTILLMKLVYCIQCHSPLAVLAFIILWLRETTYSLSCVYQGTLIILLMKLECIVSSIIPN